MAPLEKKSSRGGDCKVRDVFAVGFADYGIWVRNNSFLCEVRGCTLAGNDKANLYLHELARGNYGDFIPTLVTNCIAYGGGKGIEVARLISASRRSLTCWH